MTESWKICTHLNTDNYQVSPKNLSQIFFTLYWGKFRKISVDTNSTMLNSKLNSDFEFHIQGVPKWCRCLLKNHDFSINIEKSAFLRRHYSYFGTPCIWNSKSEFSFGFSMVELVSTLIFVNFHQFKVHNFWDKTYNPLFGTPGSRSQISTT